jgi:hypothetical protein
MAKKPKPQVTPQEQTYQAHLKDVLAKPTINQEIFDTMANGGDLITLAKAWGIRYSDLANYVSWDKAAQEVFSKGCKASEEWIKQRILNEIRSIGLVDIRQIYDDDGKLKHPKDWPDGIAAALVSVETDELFEGHGRDREQIGYTKKVRFQDKLRALEMWGKELGMFIQKHKLEFTAKLEDLVAGSNDDALPPAI